jgi:hypothetical protein
MTQARAEIEEDFVTACKAGLTDREHETLVTFWSLRHRIDVACV